MSQQLTKLVINALEDLKGKEIVTLDVRGMTNVTDTLVIVSGTSNRHVKSLANNVSVDAKKAGFMPLGIEGLETGEWVLVDFGDLIVHAMLQQTRDFYELEKLWSVTPAGRKDDSSSEDK